MKLFLFKITFICFLLLSILLPLTTWVGRANDGQTLTYYNEQRGIGIIDVERRLNAWLVADTTVVSGGQWSPDGKRLAYAAQADDTGQTDIFVVDTSTGATHNLSRSPDDDAAPVWSPDGRMLAYITALIDGNDYLGRSEVVNVIEVESGNPLDHLTQTDGLNIIQGWSPDNQILAILYQESGGSSYSAQLRFLDVTTGEYLPDLTQRDGRYYGLTWSPDGQWFTYTKQEVESTTIYLGNRQTGQVRLLPEQVVGTPHWSPDSQMIAYNVLDYSLGNSRSALVLLDVNSGQRRMITDHDGSDLIQIWTRDGDKLLIQSDRDGRRKLYLLVVSSGDYELLTPVPYFPERLQWSPNGRWLAFNSNNTRQVEVYIMDMQSLAVLRLTDGGGNFLTRWRPR